MSWEVITKNIDAFFDKPAVLVLEGVFPIIIVALVLFSKTSVGRKALNFLEGLVAGIKLTAENALNLVKEYIAATDKEIKEFEIGVEDKVDDLKKEYETKTAILISFECYFEESLFKIAEEIPNARVQKVLAEVKEEYEHKKEEIRNVVGVIYEDFDTVKEEVTKEVKKEYESKITFLENKLAEISASLSELKESGENGETETRKNSDGASETPQEN